MPMSQNVAPHALVARIGALRRQVRLLLALYGIGMVLAALCAGAVVLGFADYFLHFSPYMRLVLLVAGVVGLAVLAYRKLIGPLSTKLSDHFLASRIEKVNDLSDELTSAVDFLEADLPRNNALAAQLIASVQSHASAINFGQAAAKVSARALAIGAGALALIAIIVGANLSYSGIAWKRWSTPFAAAAWPRQTNVDFSWETTGGTKPTVWPQGEPIAIRAKVDKAYHPGMRVWLESSTDTQASTSELMTFQSAQSTRDVGIYEKVVEPIGNQVLNLRLVAGDDNEKDAVAIRLAPRPEISGIQAQVVPPPYVKNISDPSKPVPPVQFDLRSQAGRAVEGSTITVQVHSTKALGVTHALSTEPDVRFFDQNKDVEIPVAGLKRKLIDANTAELTFPAIKPLQARLQVCDTDGFENHVGGTMSMDVVPDALPSVTITDPRHQVERKPDGVVQITLNANDDLGLEELFLRVDNYDARAADSPQQAGSRFVTPVAWVSRTAEGGLATYTWDLSGTPFKPGDRLSLYAMVRDNYAMPASGVPNGQSELATDVTGIPMIRHKWVRSAPLTVQILSQEQIEQEIQHGLQSAREQIKNLLNQQTETNAKTRAIEKSAQAAGVTTQDQKQQLAELASQQAQEAQRAGAIENQIKQIQETIEGNKLTDDNLGKLAAEAQKGMNEVGQQDMPQAASDLSKAQDTAGKQDKSEAKAAAEQTAKNANNAGQNQEQAMSTMENLIKDLGAAGDFEVVREKVAAILKEQKGLNDRNRAAAGKAIGQDPSSLDPDLKKELDKIASDQEHLGKETDKVTDQMDKTADDMQKTDPASAEAMKNAADASHKNDVAGAQGNASKAIANSQTGTASNEQAQATKGLEQMMDALDQQNRKQLENLALQLRNLMDQVKGFIEKQQGIITDTQTAGASAKQDVLSPVGDRQGRLQNNVITTAAKAETLRDGRPIAMDLRDAADAMGTAAVGLLKGAQPESLPPENDALASLNAALKKIQDQLKKTEDQLKDQDLADLIKRYQGIRDRQAQVKTAADGIDQRAKQRGELLHVDAMDLAKQSGVQDTLIEEINQLSAMDKLKQYDVVIWVNSQIIDAMTQSKGLMDHTQTGTVLAATQQNALDLIDDVINALKEEKNKPDEFDKPSGSGSGSGGKPPLIPPLAQLKLLKAMQTVVNTGTRSLDAQVQATSDAAQQDGLKQQATKLGDKQTKIKDLTDGIIKKMGAE